MILNLSKLVPYKGKYLEQVALSVLRAWPVFRESLCARTCSRYEYLEYLEYLVSLDTRDTIILSYARRRSERRSCTRASEHEPFARPSCSRG